ncbi:MAG: NUDIX domain-containing protein [Thermoplasmata archaeon]|nr:NUDIX domain-containing protein [Thermoplasmata archaeon]
MTHRFVYAVAFDGDGFVMVRHRRRGWEMPGGHVEEGEAPRDAAIREFEEETGMGFDIVKQIDLGEGTVFAGVVRNATRSSPLPEEITEVKTFRELPGGLSFPLVEYERVLAMARDAVESFKRRKGISASASPLMKPLSSE